MSHPDSNGATGYRARADAREAGGGQPEQTFATIREAVDWKASVETKAAEGTFIRKSTLTVRKAIEEWRAGERGEKNTHGARRDALAPIDKELGDRKVQSITKSDVEKLLRRLANGDIEGVQQRAISYTNRTRSMWATVWEDLKKQGKLTRNVVELVKPLTEAEAPVKEDVDKGGNGDTIDPKRRLTDDEVRALLDAHAPRLGGTGDLRGHDRRAERVRLRRGVFVELAMLGLRRGELAGLRWSAISDLDGDQPTLSMVRTRVAVEGGVEEKSNGKTEEAKRTLLLPVETVEALRRLRETQADDEKRSGKS